MAHGGLESNGAVCFNRRRREEEAMGREAVCTIRYRGETAEGKALLETTELILRGDIRARIARARLQRPVVEGGTLSLIADGSALELDLGEAEAARWLQALLKAPPSLTEKLGVGHDRRALIIGDIFDPALAEALMGARTNDPGQAALFLAELSRRSDLEAALAVLATQPALPIWFIYAKGRTAEPSDAEVRSRLRTLGYIDSKSCAVSDKMTATRYVRRRT